ncbi:MAG: hypothetical protein GXO55_10195, partial [Chloroflexi bacterium]|nr:hypothetical protein [Chloroflexota bacterium]
MPTSLRTLVPRLLMGLTLHQLREQLGPEFMDTLDAALSPEGEPTQQTRLREWLAQEATAHRLLQAARAVEEYVQQHCDDPTLRQLATLGFADLPAVQDALTDLPRAMSLDAVRAALREAIRRDVP